VHGFASSQKQRAAAAAGNPCAKKSNFVSDIKLIWAVQTDSEKFSAFAVGQISASTPAIPRPQEGRFAVVTNVGRGMRWTQQRQVRE
jgi:hypothetical protein